METQQIKDLGEEVRNIAKEFTKNEEFIEILASLLEEKKEEKEKLNTEFGNEVGHVLTFIGELDGNKEFLKFMGEEEVRAPRGYESRMTNKIYFSYVLFSALTEGVGEAIISESYKKGERIFKKIEPAINLIAKALHLSLSENIIKTKGYFIVFKKITP